LEPDTRHYTNWFVNILAHNWVITSLEPTGRVRTFNLLLTLSIVETIATVEFCAAAVKIGSGLRDPTGDKENIRMGEPDEGLCKTDQEL
jgi:hypothetical protein